MAKAIRIATRKSPLALEQAQQIARWLQTHDSQLAVSFLHIQTSGDMFLDQSLAAVGGKGLFVKEIEDALLQGQADLAVHSLKDVPFLLPSGLCLAAFPPREDVRDTLILHPKWQDLPAAHGAEALRQLPPGARIGTTSLRRKTQVWRIRPDLRCDDLRGNIQTRLKKLEGFDAIILAAAGLNRMQISGFRRVEFSVDDMLPAPGQGMLAVEVRENDGDMLDLLKNISDLTRAAVVQCERAFLTALQANCHVPVAGYAQQVGNRLSMRGMVLRADGQQCAVAQRDGEIAEAAALGQGVAQDLVAQGAMAWLK